ncbi:uncharacterized protein LOC142231067 [Haematobia irritans]|uniref:uncharacterized protein LOC142231067 n=1 Tax=Haematobia irritans TaxID=7368 RepID=UPI003F4FE79F
MPLGLPPSSYVPPSYSAPNVNNTMIADEGIIGETRSRNSEFITRLYNLPHFDGKPEDWPLFLATYDDTTLEFGYSNRQNLIRLQKALHGPAKDSVLSMLIYPENVNQVMEELRFNFGRPEMLVKSQLEKIRAFPAITESRPESILGLASCARNVVAFFKSAKCEHHLVNPTLLENLILKLPLSKQYEWAKHSVSIVPFPTVEDFAKWIGELARICSLLPQRNTNATTDRQQQQQTATRRVLYSQDKNIIQKECSRCKQGHDLQDCCQFKDLATNMKWNHVKELRLCFGCLRKGHNLT